ncbi:hypothetical protein [Paenibacillus plantiphilus]|nr:hypothetical protein [Paenibacillus plantiphilus]
MIKATIFTDKNNDFYIDGIKKEASLLKKGIVNNNVNRSSNDTGGIPAI